MCYNKCDDEKYLKPCQPNRFSDDDDQPFLEDLSHRDFADDEDEQA